MITSISFFTSSSYSCECFMACVLGRCFVWVKQVLCCETTSVRCGIPLYFLIAFANIMRHTCVRVKVWSSRCQLHSSWLPMLIYIDFFKGKNIDPRTSYVSAPHQNHYLRGSLYKAKTFGGQQIRFLRAMVMRVANHLFDTLSSILWPAQGMHTNNQF